MHRPMLVKAKQHKLLLSSYGRILLDIMAFPFLSDQGRNFESEIISELCKLAEVEKVHTTSYHPMTNGQCERFNSTLCNMLGTLSEKENIDWKAYLSSMTHAYNCTQHPSTTYSPYFLMFGRQPRLPIDFEMGLPVDVLRGQL